MTPSEIIADVLKEFWAAPKLSNAIKAHYYKDPDDRSLQWDDSESYRAIDETVELLAELHPRERIWASPYDVESCVSDYLASQLPILNVDKLDDVACGIYSKVCDAGGLRCEPEPLVLVKQMSMGYSNSYYNGLTIFRG